MQKKRRRFIVQLCALPPITCSVLHGWQQIYEVTLGHGHNNNSSMAVVTGMKEGLLLPQVKVLGDGGYGAMYTVMPTD